MSKEKRQENLELEQGKPSSTEIVVSLSGVIPLADYENLRPFYSIKETYDIDINLKEKTERLRQFVGERLDADYAEIMARRVQKMRTDIRLIKAGNEHFPSVTSIINWQGIDYDPIKLQQYASRGTINHAIMREYLKTGIWKTAEEIPEILSDLMCVQQGELHLDYKECNPQGFIEKFGKDFTFDIIEKQIINEKYKYGGTPDFVGTYKGKKCVGDWKTSMTIKETGAFKQMSAYANGDGLDGIEQLVICPLNPKNKCGYGSPMITEEIEKYFSLFLQDRINFKKVYGL